MKKYPYVNIFTDRHGKKRCYFRKGGVSIKLPPPHSPSFNSEYAKAMIVFEGNLQSRKVFYGTIEGLIVEYFKSTEYITLKDSTKKAYRAEIERIRVEHGKRKVSELKPKHIKALIARKASNPAAANKFLRFMKMLMRFAIAIEWRENDPTQTIKKIKYDTEGHPDWPEDEISKYFSYWKEGTKQHLAICLFLYTGQRLSDVSSMPINHIEENTLRVKQDKTATTLHIPLHPRLKRAIAEVKREGLYLVETKYGRPYSAKSFGQTFVKWARQAGVSEGYSAHGLRKSSLRRLADLGATLTEIMAISGHKDPEQVMHYIRKRDQKLAASKAVELMEQNKYEKLQTS